MSHGWQLALAALVGGFVGAAYTDLWRYWRYRRRTRRNTDE